jgi:hypothetical protein
MLAPRDKLWACAPALAEAACDLLCVDARSTLVDLGSGDGAALFAAAGRGARAVGFEIVADRAERCRVEALARGLAIDVVTGNALDAEASPLFRPSHVFLYLIARGLRLVYPVLKRAAAATPGGLRVCTCLYAFPEDVLAQQGIELLETRRVTLSETARTPLYLYLIR